MRRLLLRFTVAAGVVLAVSLPGISAAFAGPYVNPNITLSSAFPSVGGKDAVSAEGFKPGSSADFTIHSKTVDLGTAIADADGDVSRIITIPLSFKPSSKHTIQIKGVDPQGKKITRSVKIQLSGDVPATASPSASAGSTTGAAAPSSAPSGSAAGGVVTGSSAPAGSGEPESSAVASGSAAPDSSQAAAIPSGSPGAIADAGSISTHSKGPFSGANRVAAIAATVAALAVLAAFIAFAVRRRRAFNG